MAMRDDGPDFVTWSEQFISQERGRRIVHYYLEDASGDSYLAVVGTERSLRHMLYVVSEEFCQAYGSDKLQLSSLKWRSRREVVDWLASFLPIKVCNPYNSKLPKYALKHVLGAEMQVNGCSGITGGHPVEHADGNQKSEIVWSGDSWTCGKQLQHYHAFCCNGTTIVAHSFVLVMSEEETRYLAYLEDMYEDKKGEKKVRVRWFHQSQEFACAIPAPAPRPNEVFITPYSQVISAECVDDIATVLTPEHYEKCLESLPSSAGIRLCFRQYCKSKFKLFDLRTLRGYFNQVVLACLDIHNEIGKGEEELGYDSIKEHIGPRRSRFVKVHKKFLTDHLATRISGHSARITTCKPAYQKMGYDLPFSVKFFGPRNWVTPPFKVGDKIELLCQDSGIRGCWFKCTVVELSHKKLKVCYDDVQNVDGYGNLEEWVPAFRIAAPDRLRMRCSGRLTVRPCPNFVRMLDSISVQKGMAVDVNWSDGWWEAVVIELANNNGDSVQLYLPGEDIFLICELKRLRVSKDWVGNKWVDITAKPDIFSAISSVGPRTKLASCSIIIKRVESGSSVMSDQEFVAAHANMIEEEDKQVETTSLSTDKTCVQLDDEKQTNNPRKRQIDEDAEGRCCDGPGTGYDNT